MGGRVVTGAVVVLLATAILVWPRPPDLAARLAVVGRVGVPRLAQGRRRRLGTAVGDPVSALGRRRGARSPGDLDREVLALLEGLAATLRAGLTPARALAHLAQLAQLGGLERTDQASSAAGIGPTRAGRLGDLVPRLAAQASAGARLEPIWRAAADSSGSTALLAVAEGWRMSEQHGAPIVDVLDALVLALRDRARTAAAVQTALAAPRATAALLGVLPLGGVVLGELVGVHPLSVLLGSPAGRVAAAAGLGATLGGRLWMRRLVAAASRG